jgi:hypothetical protein
VSGKSTQLCVLSQPNLSGIGIQHCSVHTKVMHDLHGVQCVLAVHKPSIPTPTCCVFEVCAAGLYCWEVQQVDVV